MDPYFSFVLLPKVTPLTGIDFTKRLPCGEVERARRSIRTFFRLRQLSLEIQNKPETKLTINAPIQRLFLPNHCSLYLSRLPLSSPDSCIQVQDVLDLSEYFYMLNCWGFTPTLCVGLLFGALQALLLPFYQTAFNLRNAISTYLRLSETRTFRLLACSSSSSKLERKNSTRRLYPNFGNLSLLRFTVCTTWGLQGCFFPCFIGLGWEVSWGSWGTIFRECTNSTIFTYVI